MITAAHNTDLTQTPQQASRLAVIPASAAALVVALGISILISWKIGIEALQGFVPGFPRMNPLTASCFIASGAALWLMLPKETSRPRRCAGQILSGFAGICGLLKLAGTLWGWNLGVDEILFHSRLSTLGHPPALMAIGTAVDFMLIAASLPILDLETRRGGRPAQFLGFIAGAIAVIDATGYAYGGQALVAFRVYRSMALPTALSFVILSFGILISRPDRGFVAVCVGSGTGAVVCRRLLPLAVTAPIVLGWLRVLGQRAGWFGSEAGMALTSAAYIIVLATIVLWTAQALHDIDNQREATQQSLRKSEERYRRRSAELEASNKELEAFCYSISHDLRTPLRGIHGFSELLLEDCGDQISTTGKAHLSRICEGTQRMSTLINDLLDLSRVTRTRMQRERIDLSALAISIAGNLRTGAPERDVEFESVPGIEAEADPELMRVVLENLIGNAWKFTTKRQHGRVEFGASQTNGSRVFFVRDNGAGFDQSHAGQLFGAFQRLHRADEFPGSGIGLATAQRIIHRHGGKIWGEGAIDKGATFYFTV